MSTFTTRLTVQFAALVTITTMIVLAVGGWLLDRETMLGLRRLHEAEFGELSAMIGTDPALTSEEITRRIHEDADEDAALFYLQVRSRAGLLLFRSKNLGDVVLPALSGQASHSTTDLPITGPVLISDFHHGPWHIQIASPLSLPRRALADYARVSGLLILGVAFVSVGLGYAFSRLTLGPLRAIEETALRIGADNLGERIAVPSGGDELSRLARLLNQMFDRLEASFAQIKRFTADASHELKTPLALIRLEAEKLRARVAQDPEASAGLADLLEEIARMNQVIESLLFIAKAESGMIALDLSWRDFPPVIAAFAEDAQVLAEDRGVRFALARNDAGQARIASSLIRQLLLNLVANAIKVSAPGRTVTLQSTRATEEWHVVVSDEGPGLPPEQLERVFERFVRYEHRAEGPAEPGHGLGLAIARSIVALHGGSIRAENRRDRTGLRVSVTLPARVA